MYVVIVGAGRVGAWLARLFLSAEYEVAVIEADPSRCASLEDELGGIWVVGDGTEADILGKAGVNRADVFIATTGRDDNNLVACQLAKHRFGASLTASLVNIPEHETLFDRLGIDITINTTELAVLKIQEEMGGLLAEEVGDLR